MNHVPQDSAHFFPLRAVGLSKNPFGTLSADEWLRVTVPPPSLEQALSAGFEHLLVMGEKGRGKSTTLHYLVNWFNAHGQPAAYERLARWQWRYKTDVRDLRVFALDEMQRIAMWEATRLFRQMRGKRLLIGSHVTHAPAFALRGLPLTVIRLEQQASAARLTQILARRLAAFALDETTAPAVTFSEEAVAYLWARFGSDLRSMNGFLYDFFQQVRTPQHIHAADLANMRPR